MDDSGPLSTTSNDDSLISTSESALIPKLAPVSFGTILRVGFAITFGTLTTCVVFPLPVYVLTRFLALFGTQRDFAGWWPVWWMKVLRMIYGVELTIEGLEHIQPGRPYVICPNHRSWLDAMGMLVALDGVTTFGFVLKRGLAQIPAIGPWMIHMGYVAVDRGKGKRGKDPLADASKRVAEGRSVVIFPEGTRAPSHRFVGFKKGAARLAMKAGVPLIPVAISGSGRLWPKGTPLARPGAMRITFLPPLVPAPEDTTVGLTRKIQQAVIENYRLTWDGPKAAEVPGLVQQLHPKR